jgi:hypothetical protein
MLKWQVLVFGERFVRDGALMGFELSGFVWADDPNLAFSKAVQLAKSQYPEIGQAELPTTPRPVINAEEIQECSVTCGPDQDEIEVDWYLEK